MAACSPQAADDYRTADGEVPEPRETPTQPIASPDTEQALWFISGENQRLLYGIPGSRPMLVLACEKEGPIPMIRVVRRSPTDAGAKALVAYIGNGQIQRLNMDASWTGRDWVWEGAFAANDERLAVFKGRRDVEVTVPAGGTLLLKASALPANLIENCASALSLEPQPLDSAPPADPPADPPG